MVLNQNMYTMASLGYKSLENPLITTKQTRPPPFFLYKTSELPPDFFFFFVRLLLPLLRSCDFRRPQAGRRHPPHKSIIFLSFPSSSSPKTIFYLTPSRLLSPLVLHHFRRVPWLRRPRQRQTRDKVSLAISLLHALLSNFDFPLLRSLLSAPFVLRRSFLVPASITAASTLHQHLTQVKLVSPFLPLA